MEHYSVLLEETISGLDIKPDGIYVDGTLGRGSHSNILASKLKNGHLYAFDKDQTAIEESKEVLAEYLDKVTFIHADFRNMKEELESRGVTKVNGIMLDLGVSSPQFDDPERGFSYRFDAKLDMRMDPDQQLSAWEVVNNYTYEQLVSILYRYGEEKFAKQIARSIEKNRPINTTFELVDVIKKALPMKVLNKKGHPAKQTFQALRIEVNGELDALQECLEEALDLLDTGGRCAIITFHSLEDRMVKECFSKMSTAPFVDKRIPLLPSQMEPASFCLVNRKPITASEEELNENHRSHSAKLRIIERVKG